VNPFMLPILAFVLWEFPSMVVMSVHILISTLRGGSFTDQFLGVWAYRIIGMVTVYPVIAVGAALADAISPGLLPVALLIEAFLVIGLVIWARFTRSGL
jgi:hypothetical protein